MFLVFFIKKFITLEIRKNPIKMAYYEKFRRKYKISKILKDSLIIQK
jgi:hypothetical protein